MLAAFRQIAGRIFTGAPNEWPVILAGQLTQLLAVSLKSFFHLSLWHVHSVPPAAYRQTPERARSSHHLLSFFASRFNY
jgi:hypothetical protein